LNYGAVCGYKITKKLWEKRVLRFGFSVLGSAFCVLRCLRIF